MEGLPKLPGLDFDYKVGKSNHRRVSSVRLKNGFMYITKPPFGPGGEPLKEDSIAFSQQEDSAYYDPVLTYGRVKNPPVQPFRPKFVIYDKIVLTFKAFFKQSVPDSPLENYRIRYVNIIYFMVDDTITVYEPEVRNCGFPQGRLVRRGKIPKNVSGQFYTWKDLNIGIDIEMNGIVFHITDCDEFTMEYMIANGVELNVPETPPVDPTTAEKIIDDASQYKKCKSNDDKLRRFLEYDGKVLSFNCILDETDRPFGECTAFKMMYFLEDDTVSIKKNKENMEGNDHFIMLLKRKKLPRIWKQQPVEFPYAYLEITDEETMEYYQPKHFRIGETIFVYGRRFLLLDCDDFTRKYFAEIIKEPQGDPLRIEFPTNPCPKREIPEYLGFGSPEDSLASCYGLTPKPPKKDILKYMTNTNKFLRFGCILDNVHPEDTIRKFVLTYSLANDTISVDEPPIRNSGFVGGRFLMPQKIPVPGCDPNMPVYYTPKDLYIGNILTIHFHRFKLTTADLFVYRYMVAHSDLFTEEQLQTVRNYLLNEGLLKDELKMEIEKECEEYKKRLEAKEPEKMPTFMEQCLKEVKCREDIEDVLTVPPMPDRRRKKVLTGEAHECPYYINIAGEETSPEVEPIDECQGNKFLAEPCQEQNLSYRKPRVQFAEDAKCAHNIPIGNCLSCHPTVN